MSKKILSVALALVLALSCFAVSAFAIGGMGYEDADATYTQAWELSEPVDNGDGTWSVDVLLTTNYKVGAIQFQINNTNPTGAVLTNAVYKNIPAEWEADIAFSNDSGKVFINANPSTDAVDAMDCNNTVIATLTFTVAADATAKINIVDAPKTESTPGGTLIAARMSDDNVVTGTAIIGQTVTSAGSTRNLGAAAAADPVLTGVNGGVVDAAGYVYGVPAGLASAADVKAYFAVTDGTFDVSATGTGATLTVYDSTNTVFATYTLVIFGDVNGDGAIDTTDEAYIIAYNMGDTTNVVATSQATLMAADVTDGTGSVDTTDEAYIIAFNMGDTTAVTVNPRT